MFEGIIIHEYIALCTLDSMHSHACTLQTISASIYSIITINFNDRIIFYSIY